MKLNKLFDYQKFQHNSSLDGIVSDVESKYYSSTARELSLDEIDYVAAAGTKKSRFIDEEKED